MEHEQQQQYKGDDDDAGDDEQREQVVVPGRRHVEAVVGTATVEAARQVHVAFVARRTRRVGTFTRHCRRNIISASLTFTTYSRFLMQPAASIHRVQRDKRQSSPYSTKRA